MIRVGSREVQVQCGDVRHSLYIEALIARGIGSDNAALRTALTFVASLLARGPAMTFGYVPTKKGTLSDDRCKPTTSYGTSGFTIPYQQLLPHRECSFGWASQEYAQATSGGLC
eukprot:7543172-Pyramimonas_sp.AAC.1